jgi:hypothetical protein
MAPGRGPVKIAAALTIAAAGFGGGFAYKRFRKYLDERKLRKEREKSRKRQASASEAQQKATSVVRKRSVKSQKQPRTRKKSGTKPGRKPRKGISEIEGSEPDSRLAARAAAKE